MRRRNYAVNKRIGLCPVCGQYSFAEPHDICPVCGWEEDKVQLRDPDFAGGANEMSLNKAREAYRRQQAEKTDSSEKE